MESPRISCVREFEKIEQMYVGNGWYSDGLTRQRDYYVAFAIHYYSLIYARLAKCEDMQRSKNSLNVQNYLQTSTFIGFQKMVQLYHLEEALFIVLRRMRFGELWYG